MHVVSVGGVTGSSNVAERKDYFEKLYNVQPNNKLAYRILFDKKLMNKLSVTSEPVISVISSS